MTTTPPPKRLPIDLPELAAILDEPRAGPVRAFFDRESGEIEHVPRELDTPEIYEDLFAAPHRWVEITPIGEEARRALRAGFLDEVVVDPQLRLKVADALSEARPFGAFARVLRETPGLGEVWERWRAGALEPVARTFLAALGVEPAPARAGVRAH
jgi:hypothetical protein